jgi:hypothetical protein
MSPLQKGHSHREEAKAAKEIENREVFFKRIDVNFQHFQSAFEFPLCAFVSFVFKKVFAVDSCMGRSLRGGMIWRQHILEGSSHRRLEWDGF